MSRQTGILAMVAIAAMGVYWLESPPAPTTKPIVAGSGDTHQFQTSYLISIDPTSAWQPRGGTVRILIESLKDDVIGRDVVVMFGWTTDSGGSNWTNSQNVHVARIDTARKIVVEAEVPDLPPAPSRRILGFGSGEGSSQLLGLVPEASAWVFIKRKAGTKRVAGEAVCHVGITSLWHGIIAAGIAIVALLGFVRGIKDGAMKGRTIWLKLIETPESKASLSQFQIVVWVLVVGAGAAYVMALSGNLIPITQGTLGLLGISGVATLGSQLATKPPLVATREPQWSDLVFCNGQIDVTRVQMLFFTLLVAIFVSINIIDNYAIPEIPQSYLGLMGISNGVYLVGKLMPDGKVKGVAMTAAGAGYGSGTTVSFAGGGGVGAAATPVIADGHITGVALVSGGAGYTGAPQVIFLDPTGGTGASATATV